LEILADILDAVGNGTKKTRIMHRANLSHKLLVKYLDQTIEAGLIIVNNDVCRVTEKGHTFLKEYNSLSRMYLRLEEELKETKFEREVLEGMCGLANRTSSRTTKLKRWERHR